MSSCVQPSLLERELEDLFMGTLSSQYYDTMLGSVSSGFSNLVIIRERIEVGMKNGKIQGEFGRQANTKKDYDTNE